MNVALCRNCIDVRHTYYEKFVLHFFFFLCWSSLAFVLFFLDPLYYNLNLTISAPADLQNPQCTHGLSAVG